MGIQAFRSMTWLPRFINRKEPRNSTYEKLLPLLISRKIIMNFQESAAQIRLLFPNLGNLYTTQSNLTFNLTTKLRSTSFMVKALALLRKPTLLNCWSWVLFWRGRMLRSSCWVFQTLLTKKLVMSIKIWKVSWILSA